MFSFACYMIDDCWVWVESDLSIFVHQNPSHTLTYTHACVHTHIPGAHSCCCSGDYSTGILRPSLPQSTNDMYTLSTQCLNTHAVPHCAIYTIKSASNLPPTPTAKNIDSATFTPTSSNGRNLKFTSQARPAAAQPDRIIGSCCAHPGKGSVCFLLLHGCKPASSIKQQSEFCNTRSSQVSA